MNNNHKLVEQLHTKFGPYLLACLNRYGVPEDDCEDARQDLYLCLLTTEVPLYLGKGFCSHMARYIALKYHRTRSRRIKTVSCAFTEDDPVMIEAAQYFMAHNLLQSQSVNLERIDRALRVTITADYECDGRVSILDIIYDLVDGKTYTEIGERFDVNKSTVCRWLNDWRGWLLEAMKENVR